MPVIIPIFHMRALRLNWDKSFVQGHFSKEEAEAGFKVRCV